MPKVSIGRHDRALVNKLVALFEERRADITLFATQVVEMMRQHEPLASHVHSLKWRIKDPTHLKHKLLRKFHEAKLAGKAFPYTTANLFTKINDLAGFRLLHLHTHQVDLINKALLGVLKEHKYELKEGPAARTWDDEYRSYFKSIGIATLGSPSMYTSVHYVIRANTRSAYTGEIQVRTLLEEVWGEVSHAINYPDEVSSVACREQLKVLARLTSSGTRLVDSVVASRNEYVRSFPKGGRRRIPRRVVR